MKKVTVLLIAILAIPMATIAGTIYTFHLDNSGFSVEFPSVPTITPMLMQHTEGVTFSATRAELQLRSVNGFIRAEVVPIEPGVATSLSDHEILSQSLAYAEQNGLNHPEASIMPETHAKCVKLRAFKTLNNTNFTYENRACYGHDTLIILYAASPSSSFPPSVITRFFNSLSAH